MSLQNQSFQLRVFVPAAACLLAAVSPARAEMITSYRTVDILDLIFGGVSLGIASGFYSMPTIIDTRFVLGSTGELDSVGDDALFATSVADVDEPSNQFVATGFPTAEVAESSVNAFGMLDRGDVRGMSVRPMTDLHRLWIIHARYAPVFVVSFPADGSVRSQPRGAPRPSPHAVRSADMLTTPRRSR